MERALKDGDSAALRERIPFLAPFARLEAIVKGYSGDGKYAAIDHDGRARFLIRTFDLGQSQRKQLEYEAMQAAYDRGVRCSQPIALGIVPGLELGYMILAYVDGDEAAEALPLLASSEQYAIGMEAGRELRLINEIECPLPMASWQQRIETKHRDYRARYATCGARIRRDDKLFAFIDARLPLLRDRPNRLRHDDFHPANLIVKDRKLSGVIDFNRCDWGDPIHEFVKVGMFAAEVSRPFAIGQMRGYHGGNEPDDSFWRLYALYLAMTMVSTVPWILQVKPGESDDMLARIHRVLDDHEDFDRIVPRWYGAI